MEVRCIAYEAEGFVAAKCGTDTYSGAVAMHDLFL